MSLRPMLDDIELQQVQFIDSDQEQILVGHAVPALEGDFWQGLGRRAGGINLAGVLTGAEAGEGLSILRDKFHAAAPVSFVADIAEAVRVDQMLIESMEVREIAGRPLRFEYAFRLREYTPPPPPRREIPPPPPPPPPRPDVGILEVEVLVEGQPEFDHGATTVSVEGEEEDGSPLSRTLNNRNGNVWREEDFPPGAYTCRAVVAGPPALTGSVSATVRPAELTRVTIVLQPGQVLAKSFILHHHFDSAFIEPCMRAVLRQVAEYAAEHPDEKLLIVGHTDESGSVAYNQALSERRARATFAYLTYGRDPAAAQAEWNELRRPRPSGVIRTVRDTWGTREYQYILQDLGYYSGNIDGVHGGQTDQAVRTFQGEKGLGVDGVVGDATWAVLIEDYLRQGNLGVGEQHFFANAENGCDGGIVKWLGCSERMPVNSTPRGQCAEPGWRPNRRTECLFVRAERLPCPVPRPATWDLPGPGVPPAWCLGPTSGGSPCCFATFDPEEGDKWLIQPAEPETVVVRGSLRFADGTPLANARFLLIDPDGEFLTGEKTCTAPKGTGIPGRTDAQGAFAFTNQPRRVGVYTLEVLEPVVVRPADDPGVEAKGNVVCKRLDGSADFDVLVCSAPATDFTLQVEGAIEVGGTGSGTFLATLAPGEEVLITAITPPGTCAAPRSITWSGGEEVPERGLQRRVSRDTITQVGITANLASAGVTRTAEIFVVRLTLDVDADRDGTVEEGAEDKNLWEFGAGRKGAIILVNCDNDNRPAGNTEIDNTNQVVDSAADLPDLAVLAVRRSGALPPGVTLTLASPQRNHIRIFDARDATATPIIGPHPAAGEATISANTGADIELGIEALRYPNPSFNGEVQLHLTLKDGATEVARDEAVVRVAPWVMPTHLEPTEELYVVETGDNAGFVSEIAAIATARGIPLHRTSNVDRWIQDTMEVGYTQMPGQTFHVVLKAMRRRELQFFARDELLGPDYGYVEVSSPTPPNTFDAHGNLEVSPPVRVSGNNYRLGRIYFGSGRPSSPFNAEFRRFLEEQKVQKPFPIDTAWLTVGHVDEVVSFIPSTTGSQGFHMLISDTGAAISLLRNLRDAGHGNLTLFTAKAKEISINNLLTELARSGAGELGWANTFCQARLDGIRTTMETELGLTAADIVRIPALFEENPRSPRTVDASLAPVFDAYVPSMVNLLVITAAAVADTHLVMAKPFGPVQASSGDQLEHEVKNRLAPVGYNAGQIHFVDNFETYHLLLGEVHCGTNSKRSPQPTPWWEQTDF
ncbi:OmpA family protein [Geoalkalibacter ferrihydriticus]|uniref:OmpA family protein n=1 Tax=Geoalkalibacter ferrihydriticus TaxID=392333 RepID=A0A1G9JGE6_9BACT|nr:protein-arginine deiminase family protein [Geoalkalibacter ferrihydriticus]SDL36193.1 OmpA family protein [Geoalkalibacter ferrihydriticus]